MKAIALRHILYFSKQYAPGEEVFIGDSNFLKALEMSGSVKLVDDDIEDTDVKTDFEFKDEDDSKLKKQIGRRK